MNTDQLSATLSKYVPERAVSICIDWILKYRISVRITKTRMSKYGDYSPPSGNKGHHISVNHELNPFSFLLTFTHEVAHLVTWNKYQNRVESHGVEWQLEYKQLVDPLIKSGMFPNDITLQLNRHFRKPKATSCSDIELTRVLNRYNTKLDSWIHLEEIEINENFRIRSGRIFKKGMKRRKNYSCQELQNNHFYYINPLTEVQKVDDI